ncbi:peptidoglycan DD-metalloendopeptidase family protein [Rathayibacter sp. KR2-224]|uniref:peptidoglycan DD-metalloendopeptidase family protein n=1 Tax=Rathayibacter sp. KR2-224 TaxID=3400913 RepID=UPI003C06DD9A
MAGRRTVSRGYEAPPSRYTAGHRGVDIPAVEGAAVVSPAAGSVRFAGVVVDRPTVTVQTGSGILISIEPVSTPYSVGDVVMQDAPLGVVSRGGHCDGVCIHLGVRIKGDYVSPMRFFGGIPRAVLLPIR